MRRLSHPGSLFLAFSLLASAAGLLAHPTAARGDPAVADPSRWKIELYADFTSLGLKAFGSLITPGEQNFGPGLYVTGGATTDTRADRLVRVYGPGQTEVVQGGFVSSEAIQFARGSYGQGLLITEIYNNDIVRLTQAPDGTITKSVFASMPTPSGMCYGPDGLLYVNSFSSGKMMRVDPSGLAADLATIPLPTSPSITLAGAKSICQNNFAGSGFLAGTFSFGTAGEAIDSLYTVNLPASGPPEIASLKTGFQGLELVQFGPGGDWGTDLYVPMIGTVGVPGNHDGALNVMDQYGALQPLITGIDAVSVAFDTESVLGGGMFVTDLNDGYYGKVWRVTIVPEPSATAVALTFACLVAAARPTRRPRDRRWG